MNTQLYPTDLADSQWIIIQESIPKAKPGRTTPQPGYAAGRQCRSVCGRGRHPVADAATGIPEMAKRVQLLSRAWKRSGLWKRIHDTLRAKVRQRAGRHKHRTGGCLDSQSVKTTAVPGSRGFDKAKLINGRKRPILVDTTGLLLAVKVTAASVQSGGCTAALRPAGRRLQEAPPDPGVPLLRIVASCSLGSPSAFSSGSRSCCARQNRKASHWLPWRWLVERTFAWFNHHRRLSKDYEGQESSSEAMIYIVMILPTLRRLAHD